MSKRHELHQVIVKSLSTHNTTQETFDFFSNPKNMELGGAIHSMQKSSDDWFTFDHNVAGKSKMKLTVNRDLKYSTIYSKVQDLNGMCMLEWSQMEMSQPLLGRL